MSSKLRSAGICLLLSTFALGSFAQQDPLAADTFDIRQESFLLPLGHPIGKKFRHSIAIYYVVPPRDWTLDIVKAPMFNYTGKYLLPKGFNLQGGISTLLISNRLNLGPFWNKSFDNFHVGIGYQVAFNYGFLKSFGFNTVLTGWEQQPSVTLGYSFKKTAVTVRGDLYYTNSIIYSEAGNDIENKEPFMNGYSVTGAFEQRIHKNRVMSLGLKINYLRYHIIAWPALPVNSFRYVVPEFQISLNY